MDWKNLVVFADASPAGLARISTGLELAGRSNAHLEAIAFQTPAELPLGVELPAIDDTFQRLTDAAQREAQETARAMRACGSSGRFFSAHAELVPDANVADRATIAAVGADLVIAGAPEGDRRSADSLHAALLKTGTPCLVMPNWIAPRPWGKRALIAWKQTPQAARALRAALPLLAAAEQLRLVIVDPEATLIADLDRLAARLLRHGIRIERPVQIESFLDEVGRAIADEAEGFGADLIVMGAYGHAPLLERALGGVTQHMLKYTPAPLLLAH